MIEKRGIYCDIEWKVYAHEMGHRCGYVKVPKGHPFHGLHYTKIPDLGVHGGLTYSETDDNGDHWIGFDCAHAGDGRDFSIMSPKYKRFLKLFPLLDGHMWTAEDVKAECIRLCAQLIKISED